MKAVSSHTHGIIDYATAVLLFFAPEIFDFANVAGAEFMARTVAIIIVAQNLISDYDLGVFPVISMRTHLVMDYLIGAVLAFSPWLFGFSQYSGNVWLPHLVVGLMIVGLAYVTVPATSTTTRHPHAV